LRGVGARGEGSGGSGYGWVSVPCANLAQTRPEEKQNEIGECRRRGGCTSKLAGVFDGRLGGLGLLSLGLALLLGGGVLVLLVLGDEVVHVGLGLGELHLVHA